MSYLFSKKPAAALVVLNWLCVMATALVSLVISTNGGNALVFAFAYALLSQSFPVFNKKWRGTVAAVAITGQAIACTVLFTGHPWQLDSQMWLYAALASTLILKEERAIIIAATVSMLTFLVLALAAPGLLYFQLGLWELWGRLGFQSISLFALTLALLGMTRVRLAMHAHREAKELALKQAHDAAVKAREGAEHEAQRAEQRTQEAEDLAQKAQEAAAALQRSQIKRQELEQAAQDAEHRENQHRETMRLRQARTLASIKSGLKHVRNGALDSAKLTDIAEDDADLREDFDAMVATLKKIVGTLGERAQDIGFQAAELNQGADALSDRTKRQATSLEEAAGALQQVLSQAQATNSMAREAASATSSAKSHAAHSGQTVDSASVAISKIEESSAEIARITTVIDDIAFQTNLLALNAGIEAVRAGEAGRGFSVVANEVRALAQRSGAAARDISEIVDRSASDVDEGVGHITKTVSVLSDTISAITNAADQVDRIRLASEDQLARMDEVSSAATELDRFTQENTKMIQNSGDSIKRLADNAHMLRDITQQFSIDDASAQPASVTKPNGLPVL
ncbi:MAG: methyl-accepting chemotaxis protein [Pseudomonadota bacterium]